MSETENAENKIDIGVSGAVTYWELSSISDLSATCDGLTALGYKEFLPEPRTPSAALKSAMGEVFGGNGVMIRPLDDPDNNGFTAVREIRGSQSNQYSTVATVKFDSSAKLVYSEGVKDADKLRIEAAWIYHMSIVSQSTLANVLVKIITTDAVEGGLSGTTLKPAGGIYWVPATQLPKYEALVEVLKHVALGNRANKIYFLRIVYDKDSVEAVKDAIIRDITEHAKEIEEDSKTAGLGELAYRHRIEDAESLHDRIAAYEGMLGSLAADAAKALHSLAEQTKDSVLDMACQALPNVFAPKQDETDSQP